MGEADLQKALSAMEPVLEEGVFVFVTLPGARISDPEVVDLDPMGLFYEKEGLSLIVREEQARKKEYPVDEPMRLISLTVHSALSMCGLTAAISTKLAARGISCNVVAAYHHDHLFVDSVRADDAMQALSELSAASQADSPLKLHINYMSGGDVADVVMRCSDSVLQLKAAVEEASGIPAGQQRLFAGAHELLDDVKLQATPLMQEPTALLVNHGIKRRMEKESVAQYDGTNVAEAALRGALGDVMRLVEAGHDINDKYDYGYAALHHMAAVPGASGGAYGYMKPDTAAAMIRWLLERRADINQGDNGGKTPLHVLGKYGGHMDQLHALLEGSPDVNQPMSYGVGWTPLWYVRNYKVPLWREFERVLLERGAVRVPDELDVPDEFE